MLQPWIQGKDEIRFRTAGRLVEELMDSIYTINPAVEFGLRVYGHQTPAQNNDCYDSKREVSFSKDNRTQMSLRLASIQPRGVSPIAYSLQQAAEYDLQQEVENAYSIILITDGGESCNGNICDVVNELLKRKIFFKPYVLSLVDDLGLQKQYDCLGNYLTAGTPAGLQKSIHTILEDYRPILQAKEMVTVVPKQFIPTVPVKQEVVVPRPIVATAVPTKDNLAVAVIQSLKIYTTAGPSRIRYVPASIQRVAISQNLPNGPLPKLEQVEVIVAKTEVPSAKLPIAQVAKPSAQVVKAITIPEEPVVVVVAETPKPKPKPPVVKPKPPVAKTTEASYSIKRENDEETLLQIYFTDGRGTYYSSTPQMQIVKEGDTEPVKFYRTLDANGEPDPRKITAGVYTISVPGRSTTYMRRVSIEAGKRNKIDVIVNQGSLRFSYENNTERPVVEYEAQVKKSLGRGPIINQRCTSELPYPPDMYHIEINTLPVLRYTTDITFSSVTNILIPEPGFLQITNTAPVGRVVLYVQRGSNMVSFHTLNVTGNVGEQRVDILPGSYQARFIKSPGTAIAREIVVPFVIRTTATQELELQ